MSAENSPGPSSAQQSASCPNCHSLVLTTLFEAPAFESHLTDRFTLARCGNCGVVSTTAVSAAQLNDAYSTDYYGDERSKFSDILEKLLAFAARRQARALTKKWHSSSKAHPRVLDIGCGRGILLNAFQTDGASVAGIERDTFPGRPDYVHIGSLADEAFQGQVFDIVVIWHVLEHLTEIDQLLTQIKSHLAPGAMLVITVPNFASWQRQTFQAQWFHLDIPRHLLHIEPHWLGKRLEKTGFNVQSVSHFDWVQGPFGFIQSAMNKIFPTARNRFYTLLKQRGSVGLPLLGWGLLAAVLAPFAALESVFSAVTKQGATFVMIAKPEHS